MDRGAVRMAAAAGFAVGGMAAYAFVRTVRTPGELGDALAEAGGAVRGRERDELRQALSAISLKGELALRLLRRDEPAARAQIADLTGIAREALHGMRAGAAGGRWPVPLRTEASGVGALLAAAGIEVDVDLAGLADVPPAMAGTLAWGIRSGVTHLLRHDAARTCSITVRRHGSVVRLEIVHDGTQATAGRDDELAALTGQVRALAGRVVAGRLGDGRFRLLVEIPEEAP